MFCKNCGKQIDDKAKTCPSCGAKQKKKHTVLWAVLAAVVVMFVVVACSSGGSDDKKPQVVDNGETVSADATTEPAATEKSVFSVGEAVEYDGVTVTLKSVEESMGDEFFKPDSGKVFILCEFEIANNSDDKISVSSIMSFDAYIDDYSVDMDFSATSSSDKEQLDGSVAVGKKLSGVIGYAAPEDWKTLEVGFMPHAFDDPIVFQYSK